MNVYKVITNTIYKLIFKEKYDFARKRRKVKDRDLIPRKNINILYKSIKE